MELTLNEKKLLVALGPVGSADAADLADLMETRREAVVQYANLAGERGLVDVEKRVSRRYTPTEEGQAYIGKGLPERQVIESFGETIPMRDLQSHPLAKIAIGWMRKKNWVAIKDGVVQKTGNTAPGPDEAAFAHLSETGAIEDGVGVADLVKRGLVEEEETVAYTVSITPQGRQLLAGGLDLQEEAGTFTREQILSGSWKDLPLRRYDVGKLPKAGSCRVRSGTSTPSSSRRTTRPGRCRTPSSSASAGRSRQGMSMSAICTSMAARPHPPGGEAPGALQRPSSACSGPIRRASPSSTWRSTPNPR
ncbi:MAG: Phenylalanine--tRNA ligase alpha subunit [Methanoculleus marisnigri]|uniref:Phenylalanine--tRNA ligase alpha subunit n=1 Tax=Methanoculleus marisnigri TaxID=2198 RepID=A0A101GKV7_9EURY|nr:MAG: Phenylalanine--tRNA ligase alpha subunit [Methanoculleus marisnigri]